MSRMKVEVDRRVTNKARRLAREFFPCEMYMYLLGRVYKNKVKICDYHVPADLAANSSEEGIWTPKCWVKQAKKYAQSQGLIIVGDIHSHPYQNVEVQTVHPDCLSASPSEWDYDHPGVGGIQGILVILEKDNGSLVTRTKFYGPQLQLNLKIV